jgi:hypothetical protein
VKATHTRTLIQIRQAEKGSPFPTHGAIVADFLVVVVSMVI